MALKATPDEQARLLEVQSLDTRIQQLDHRAKSLPEHAALRELESSRLALTRSLTERTGEREDIAIELRRLESDVAVVEARIARDTDRVQSSSSAKDITALEHELTSLRKRLGDLEEIELTVMERLELQDAAVAEATAELAGVQTRATALESARDAALAELHAERRDVVAARSSLAARVPADVLALYEKQRARYGWGASHLRGGVSSASGVRLNESDLKAIRAAAADDVVLCPDSNAILVRTDESGL